MDEEARKDGRGGARAGAGRPRGITKPYKKVTISMPEEYAIKLKKLSKQKCKSYSQLIKDLIDRSLK